MEDILGIQNSSIDIGSGGVGYIVVPFENERDNYIADCYSTNRVTIHGGRGYSFFNSVPCPLSVMSCIEFPEDGELGTPVIWIKDDVSGLPVIVASLEKEGNGVNIKGGQFRVSKGNGSTKSVELFIDGKTSAFQLNVLGDAESPSNVDIKVNSKNSDSKVNLYCDNEVNLFADKKLTLNTTGSFELNVSDNGTLKSYLKFELNKGLTYADEFKNSFSIIDGKIVFKSKEINLGEGSNPLVLGNVLNEVLGELIDTLSTMIVTVTPPTGVLSPPTILKLTSIRGKLSTVLSKMANTD